MSKRKTDTWDRLRGRIVSNRGGWRVADGRIYLAGYSMLEDFVGEYSWFQIMVLNATGRLISSALSQWLEAVYICISWPDSRIWCNQVASFAGALRAPAVAAVSAGLLASHARIYGVGPLKGIASFLALARCQLETDSNVGAFLSTHATDSSGQWRVPGYARPLARGDERVPVMDTLSFGKLGFSRGPHLEAAYRMSEYLYENIDETINIGGFICAFLLDAEFSPDEISRVFALLTNGGMHACYSEAADGPPLGYLPLRCDDVEYIGPKDRTIDQGK